MNVPKIVESILSRSFKVSIKAKNNSRFSTAQSRIALVSPRASVNARTIELGTEGVASASPLRRTVCLGLPHGGGSLSRSLKRP